MSFHAQLPNPHFPSTCISHAVLTASLEHSTCQNQWSILSKNEVKVLKLKLWRTPISPATEWYRADRKSKVQTHELKLWPRPSAHPLNQTFQQNFMKIIPGIKWSWTYIEIKAQTYDLQLGPRPWVGVVELWVLHIISLSQTYDQSLLKILLVVEEILIDKLKAKSHDLQLWPWPWVCMAESWSLHTFCLRWPFDQILMKSFEGFNSSGDTFCMEQTWN